MSTTNQPKKYVFPPSQVELAEIRAPIMIPPMEDISVRLVPSHLLERLEEYRSDENKAYLLIGLFGGSILGVLGNWATNENFTITRVSMVLIGIMFCLTIACIWWAYRINQRASRVRDQMLSSTITSQSNFEHPTNNNP